MGGGGEQMEKLDYDLQAACECNEIVSSDLSEVLLELTGENDEASWHWILSTKTGGFAYISGYCDYTGWECQSGADRFDAATQEAALALCPQDVRRVFEDMIAKGEKVRSNTGGL